MDNPSAHVKRIRLSKEAHIQSLLVEREELIRIWRGPTMKVTVTSPAGITKSWDVLKSKLEDHSGYFRRLQRFKEGVDNEVRLADLDHDTLARFVYFMYDSKDYGHFLWCDSKEQMKNPVGIHRAAKAWVLGDYLDATEFRKCTVQQLLALHSPKYNSTANILGPETILYCCESTDSESSLIALFIPVAAFYWYDSEYVLRNDSNNKCWDLIREKFPKTYNRILGKAEIYQDWRNQYQSWKDQCPYADRLGTWHEYQRETSCYSRLQKVVEFKEV